MGGKRTRRIAKTFDGKENWASLHHSTSVTHFRMDSLRTPITAKNEKQIPRCARNDIPPRFCQAGRGGAAPLGPCKPYPPPIWMNIKGKDLKNLHFVIDLF